MDNDNDRVSLKSSNMDDSDEDGWLDINSDEEQVTIISLFDTKTFSTLPTMLGYCKDQHGFDLTANIRRLKLDFHGAVKLINFIRVSVREQQALPDPICLSDFEDNKHLKPVLENDALIFCLDEILESVHSGVNTEAELDRTSGLDLQARNSELEAELESLQSRFAAFRLTVQETLDRRWDEEKEQTTSTVTKKDVSEYYFESYASYDIHETMLKDETRTNAYRDFIYENKHLFRDKVVLDIGCGTGILSMFCARAGAKLVIAVDKSDIIIKARENVFNNGLSNTITCLKGAIEDVTLPVDKVDVIVSEWMGYCLLYEAMLPSVLFARDHYLKPDGILAPSSATLWIAPTKDSEYTAEHISYWRDVYGFDMKAMQEGIYEDVRILSTSKDSLCGEPFPFKTIDLRSVNADDLAFTADWESNLTREEILDGFVIWFDNFFITSANQTMPESLDTPERWVSKNAGNVAFTTGPYGIDTHWHQGRLLVSPDQSLAEISLPCKVTGQISFSALEENVRALTIQVSWAAEGQTRNQSWSLK